MDAQAVVSTDIEENARRLVRASKSPNTIRNYQCALRRLDAWLEIHGRPVDDHAIADYITVLFGRNKSYQTALSVLRAARFRAKTLGDESPVGIHTLTRMQGYRREAAGRGTGQAKGVSWEDVDRAVAMALRDKTLSCYRDAAILAVASDGLLRVSELRAATVEDVRYTTDGSGVLWLPRSKTDQYGNGASVYLGPPTVVRVHRLLEVGGYREGPLFRRLRFGHRGDQAAFDDVPMSYDQMLRVVRARFADIGIDDVTCHSFRVGSAQSLVRNGGDLIELQQAGRWTSPSTVYGYVKNEIAERGPVARRRYGRKDSRMEA